jgi:4-hydroxy-tetrahydrodipicolinate reductase
MKLVGAISRKHKGENLGTVLNLASADIPIFGDVETALKEVDFDVLVNIQSQTVQWRTSSLLLKKVRM